MLHSINFPQKNNLWENECLKLSPPTLRQMIEYAALRGCKFVTIKEMLDIKKHRIRANRLLCISLDDGYIDNYTNGYPCFKAFGVPFCLNITTGVPNGEFVFWWHLLEDILLEREFIQLSTGEMFFCRNKEERSYAFKIIRQKILTMQQISPKEKMQRLFPSIKHDFANRSTRMGITWDMIKILSKDPLVTIGNHSDLHPAFHACTLEEINKELLNSQKALQTQAKIQTNIFAYPYGSLAKEETNVFTNNGINTIMTVRQDFVRYGSDQMNLPRLEINELNWKQVIDSVIENC